MAIKNYQIDGRKYSKKINLFKITRNRKKSGMSYEEHFQEKLNIWVAYWRANPHRFVEEVLNIKLMFFQVILLWAMMHHNVFMLITSRGLGKSFLSAVYLVTRCILYPGSKIIIAAGTKGQSIGVLEKIKDELMPNSQVLAREISDVSLSLQSAGITFHNGSFIRVVAATDSARGKRGNILLVDEFRMVKQSVIDAVLKKFLTSPRRPKFYDKQEYKNYPQETNKRMFLSSAWYKNHWSYDSMLSYTNRMIAGGKYFVAHLPYQVGLYETLYDKESFLEEMSEDGFNEITWMMEMEAVWYGESEKSFFKFIDIESNRKEPDAFYPLEVQDLINGVSIAPPKKTPKEIRILGVDIAVTGGADNDASVFSVLQLKESGTQYERNIVYMESLEGVHSEQQAIRIRQLMDDFDIDYLAFDISGVGIGVFDNLVTPLFDDERGVKYEPINYLNDDQYPQYSNRCKHPDAEKKIFLIRATKEMNMEIAGAFSDGLKRGKINLLIKEQSAIEKFQRNKKLRYLSLDPRVKAELLLPYRQMEQLSQEMLNLETIRDDSGAFRLVEQGRMRKDRYSSVSYANYYANILERKNLRESGRKTNDTSKFAIFRKPKI